MTANPEHAKLAHEHYDRRFPELLRKPDWQPTTCCKGCHACCAEPLLVNVGEAELILESIAPEELPGVMERTGQWIDAAERSGMLRIKEPPVVPYLQAKLMCPLMKNGLCLVYENRPLGCRAHFAIGDPALCHDPEKRLRQKYMFSPQLNQQSGYILFAAGDRGDHLGAWLARRLLGRTVMSAAYVKYPYRFLRFEGPDDKKTMVFEQTGPWKK